MQPKSRFLTRAHLSAGDMRPKWDVIGRLIEALVLRLLDRMFLRLEHLLDLFSRGLLPPLPQETPRAPRPQSPRTAPQTRTNRPRPDSVRRTQTQATPEIRLPRPQIYAHSAPAPLSPQSAKTRPTEADRRKTRLQPKSQTHVHFVTIS